MPIKAIFWILLVYLVYCGFLFLMQRQILFPRYLIDTPSKSEDHPFMEKIWIKTSFGRIEAWFLPPDPINKTEPSPAVIFAHGNGEIIDFWPDELKRFNHFGIGVMLLEYPGYGRSERRGPGQNHFVRAFLGWRCGMHTCRGATHCSTHPHVDVYQRAFICKKIFCSRISCPGPVQQSCCCPQL